MGNVNSPDDRSTTATAAERRLRGTELEGAEQKSSADHTKYEETRRPDTELRLDGESDKLYDDGLDIDEEQEPPAGTRDASSGIKP